MPAIEKIHGYLRSTTDRNDQAQRSIVRETVLIEATSPLTTQQQIVLALPSYVSGPGNATFNPLQITVTQNQSRHAHYGNYIIENVGSLKRSSTSDKYWHLALTYSAGGTGVYGVGTSTPKEKRKDQKVKKPDSTNEADNEPITNPVDRPPIFTGSSKIVMRKSLFDLNNNLIRHTNYLPITTPVPIPVSHKVWTWDWNVDAKTFNMTDFDDVDNFCNDGGVDLLQGTAPSTYTVDAFLMKCMGFSFKEVWETPDGTEVPYHFVRVTGKFEVSPDPWNQVPRSLHTMQRRASTNKLIEIPINDTGLPTTTPWPLDPNGNAISYDDLPTAVPSDYGVLQADGADLIVTGTANFANFFAIHKLRLPRQAL